MSTHPIRQEDDRVPARPILRVAVAGAIVGAVSVFVAWLLWMHGERAPAALRGRGGAISGSVQRLLESEQPQQRLQARENARLRSYGWVDRDGGVVHIPIEKAMELVAGTGRR
jgi:hypothetical protein